jgi:ribosomal protein L11 methylase PrmA
MAVWLHHTMPPQNGATNSKWPMEELLTELLYAAKALNQLMIGSHNSSVQHYYNADKFNNNSKKNLNPNKNNDKTLISHLQNKSSTLNFSIIPFILLLLLFY